MDHLKMVEDLANATGSLETELRREHEKDIKMLESGYAKKIQTMEDKIQAIAFSKKEESEKMKAEIESQHEKHRA